MKQDAQDVSSTPHDAEPAQDAQDSREPTLGSLRWAVDCEDYDQLMAMGDLSGADVWAQEYMNL